MKNKTINDPKSNCAEQRLYIFIIKPFEVFFTVKLGKFCIEPEVVRMPELLQFQFIGNI